MSQSSRGFHLLLLVLLLWKYDVSSKEEKEATYSPECANLLPLFKTVHEEYYELLPHMVGTHPSDTYDVLNKFKPFDPSPENLRKVAERAKELYNKLGNLKGKGDKPLELDNCHPRERRVYHQMRYFLRHNFDNPYQGYFDGIWMLGPDFFCEQDICGIGNHLESALLRLDPLNTMDELNEILRWIDAHKKTFEQYKTNMQKGVESGMVSNTELCKAVGNAFKHKYSSVKRNITCETCENPGADGALDMKFAQILLEERKADPEEAYLLFNVDLSPHLFPTKENKPIRQIIREKIVSNIGKPLYALMKYLYEERHKNCVPSDLSSGLAGLPLKKVYENGQIKKSATGRLPVNTEKCEACQQKKSEASCQECQGVKIDTKTGYQNLLAYYTTIETTPAQVNKTGWDLIHQFFDEAVEIAKYTTKINDKAKAIEQFQVKLNNQTNFYNQEDFPDSESDSKAHEKCDNEAGAKASCPKRWEALEKWFDGNRLIMKKGENASKNMFYVSGDKKCIPDCALNLVPDYNPSSGAPTYLEDDAECNYNATYSIPFFKDKMGPKYADHNTNFHETRPGHHLQIQGFLENFEKGHRCGKISAWLNDILSYYPAFSEGWGMYAENPLLLHDSKEMLSTKLEKYGVLKWQIWRALRLVVDVGFHNFNKTRTWAKEQFDQYLWGDNSQTVEKELTRYQGTPGQATSYTTGQQTIIKLRKEAEEKLGNCFNLKEFHYHMLKEGQAPFYHILPYMKKYIKDAEQQCDSPTNEKKRCTNCEYLDEPCSVDGERSPIMQHIYKLFRKRTHY